MRYEDKLALAGYPIPSGEKRSDRPFEDGVQAGDLIFVSGNAARVNGVLKYTGIVGDTVTLEEARDAARICLVNCLRAVRDLTGSLDAVERIVNIKGYVASTARFTAHPEVMNAASDLANTVFGEAGRHSRCAVGAASLPGGTPVEVEIVVKVKRAFRPDTSEAMRRSS